MRRATVLLACAALNACGQSPQSPPTTTPKVTSAASEQTAVVTDLPGIPVENSSAIVGEWRVSEVDGQPLSQTYGMSASIGAASIHVVSQCVRMHWTYRLNNGVIETTAVRPEVPPCARTRSADEQAVEAVLDHASSLRRLPSGALLFAGASGTVALKRNHAPNAAGGGAQ